MSVSNAGRFDAANFNLISFAINAVDSSTSWYGATLAQTPFTLQPEPALPISSLDDRRSQNFRSNSGGCRVAVALNQLARLRQ